MLILAISTSSKNCSAAVFTDRGSFIREDSTNTSHSAKLMGLIEQALDAAGVSKRDIETIAVDIGPGSFTGVRIGVSCANAMAYALGVPLIPVCSLDAMIPSFGAEGVFAALIDCRNGNCYAEVAENGAVILPPCAAVTAEVLAGLPEGAVILGDVKEANFLPNMPGAGRVALRALRGDIEPVKYAVPMYLRPSQAERMKNK